MNTELYNKIIKLKLTDSQLKSNSFPQPHPYDGLLAKISNPHNHRLYHQGHGNNRYCRRCETPFTLDHYNVTRYRSCQYHPKFLGLGRGMYKCISCDRFKSDAGCQCADYHVHEYTDYSQLTGFIKLEMDLNNVPSDKDIFSLDCESLYTTDGMEIARVSVIDINSKCIYNEFIKPTKTIIDYNTEFSGLNENNLANATKTLADVQNDLKKILNSSTILIGHGLDSDLVSLKIVHDKIVDTSVLFPHPSGPPRKLPLKALSEKFLNRSIQKGGAKGHDSAEDAEVCIELIKHYLKTHPN